LIRHIVAPDPGRSVFAVCRGPRHPSRVTRLLLAAGHGGVPWHDEIEILPGGWRPRVSGAFGIPVWHPSRPLLAGLAARDGHPSPWIADLDSREVIVFDQVRAAVSPARPCCPLAWCAGGLLFLRPEGASPDLEPQVFEARGPAFVTFDEHAEPVRVARLDTATGLFSVLTDPLVVRDLTPAGLVESDDGGWYRLDAGSGLRAVPAPVPDPLVEGATVLDAADGVLACRSADGRAGLARTDSTLIWVSDPRRAVRAWVARAGLAVQYPDAIARYRLEDGVLRQVAEYALTSPPLPAARSSGASYRDLPLLLRVRPRLADQDQIAVADAGLDAPVTEMNLSLALDWPPAATASYLTNQVARAIERTLETAATRYGDRYNGRVVIAGSSFGATLALLALARFPQLAGAIAISGCYNRTLVPTGFQYEHRSYWQAPDVYHAFSPLMFADQLDRPVLLLHGAEDNNPNTSPAQATDLYKAIIATGGHARLVLFPAEGHVFRYAETLTTSRSEQLSWLRRCREL
jgi:dienelactone hydrolase